MRKAVLHRLVVIVLLSVGFSTSAISQPAQISVRQHVMTKIESNAYAEMCALQHPTLKIAIDGATTNYRLRMSSILNALLETDDFRSLAEAQMPEDLIASAAASDALVRCNSSGITLTLDQCNEILSDLNTADEETLRFVLTQMLVATKGLIESRKLREKKS